jgi:hypothetical protein
MPLFPGPQNSAFLDIVLARVMRLGSELVGGFVDDLGGSSRRQLNAGSACSFSGGLARRLYEEMVRLDPSGEPSWDALSDLERDFYYSPLRAVFAEYADVLRILKVDYANHHNVCWGLDLGEETNVHN